MEALLGVDATQAARLGPEVHKHAAMCGDDTTSW